ncbi:MAG TPA: protein kinase [Candidatus Binatia bacterium]|nr:protein kinase [Candidatus Binatia bacterium]
MKICPICNRRFGDDVEACDFDGNLLWQSNRDPLLGTTLNNRYRIIEKFGQGSMSTVYLAEQIHVDRKVLLKILSEEYAQDEAFVKRFRQEAKLLSTLNNPRLIQLYDFDQADDGRLYIVTEYLRGKSLKTLLQDRILEIPTVVRIASQLVAGLAAAHSAGVIHRDITSDNILLVGDREDVKITDFGLARSKESKATTRLTQVGTILGNPYYVSPEQIEGFDTDERTDVYSFGIVLYEMLCNKVPFNAPTPTAVWMQHLNDRPLPPSQLRPQMPSRLEEIALRALEKKPQDRWARMSDIAELLSKIEKEPAETTARTKAPTDRLTSTPGPTPQTDRGAVTPQFPSEPVRIGQAQSVPHELNTHTVVIDASEVGPYAASSANETGNENSAAQTMVMTEVFDAVPRRKIPWHWIGLAGVAALTFAVASWHFFSEDRVPQEQAKQSASPNSKNIRTPAKLESISLEIDKSKLAVGQSEKLRLQARLTDGSQSLIEQTDRISFVSSNPSVAIVDIRGNVTATGSGSAELRARHEGLESAPITLVVTGATSKTTTEVKLLSLEIKGSPQQLAANERVKLYAIGKFSNNREAAVKTGIRWESKNPSIATIDGKGTLVGRSEGDVEIIARYGEIASPPLNLHIKPRPAAVTKGFDPKATTLPPVKAPNVSAQLRNARVYLDQGQYSEALNELTKASKIDPGNQEVQTAIADAKRACNAEKRLGRSDLKC